MKTRHLAVLLLGLPLCACSNGQAAIVSGGGGGAAPVRPTSAATGIQGPLTTPTYLHFDMSKPVRVTVDCTPMAKPPPLHYVLLHTGLTDSDPQQEGRVAAIVTLTGIGPGRWNTPDGTRPSQAYIDALQHPTQAPDGTWPDQPTIATPATFQVNRVLRGSLPASTVVAYHDGGQAGQDTIGGCDTTADHFGPPKLGATYLVLFSRELTTQGTGSRPVVQPLIGDMYLYDPVTDLVRESRVSTKLADALKGLPPG